MNEQTLFAEALERTDPKERAAFLDQACQSDPALRHRIERLFAQHQHAGSFLESPAPSLDPTLDRLPTEATGTIIGPYKLVEQIGEGGMGTVWMAQQTEPVKRLVAVKLIKAGMDSKQVIARFEAERQALALMDHANIARVLDAGTSSNGRPYFVMDLVKGVPITKYCDEHHLTPRQRLELFVPVCQAVQHAHLKGIIHRDLKPSNVLVALYDGKPVPKVIDFGVAKATGQQLTEKTLVTGFGNIVGTLEYMSPEQAEFNQLDIDTRSDIYSLGVLLYELLTGSPPFTLKELEKAGMLEMLRIIREQEPSKPSTKLSTAQGLPTLAANRGSEPTKLTKLVRGELDWIVMKALEKDRSRRYETAKSFAMDVQCYLLDEPVQACPPSVAYQLRKFVRRNRGKLVAAAVLATALLLAIGGVGWAVRDRAAQQADIERDKAERLARVSSTVRPILAETDLLMADQKWPEALATARRAGAAVTGGEADVDTTRRVRDLLKDVEFIVRLEKIRMSRSTIVEGQFDIAGVDREYVRAFRDYGVDVDQLAVEASIDRLKARTGLAIPLAAALDDWVDSRRAISTVDTAGWERLVAVARGIDPEPLRDKVRSTWGQSGSTAVDELRTLAQSIELRAQHPATLATLAHTLLRAKHFDIALRLLRDAQYAYPGDFWLNFELGMALHGYNDSVGASRFFTAAISIRPTSAMAHNNLGTVLRDQNKLDEATTCYNKAIELEPKFALPHSNLGGVLRMQKRLDEAIAASRKAIELDPKHARAHWILSNILCDQNKLDEALAASRKAIELAPKSSFAYSGLAYVLSSQKKPDEAMVFYQKAIELDWRNVVAHSGLGSILCDVKRDYEGALACFRKAVSINPNVVQGWTNLGNAYAGLKQQDKAITAYRKAIEVDPNYPGTYRNLGITLRARGIWDEAIATFEAGMRLTPKNHAIVNDLAWLLAACPDPKYRNPARAVELAKKAIELAPTQIPYSNTLGLSQYRAGNWNAAIEALDKSMELRQGGNSYDWFFLAMAHWQLGDKHTALKWYNQAVEWTDKHQPKNAELRRFQTEAAQLIGVEKKQD